MHKYPTPSGYNEHDYQKMVTFFEQIDENGIRNGERMGDGYNPADPTTWDTVTHWHEEGGEMRLSSINMHNSFMAGTLDVSDCTELSYIACANNNITALNVTGCTQLDYLDCSHNPLQALDVQSCTNLWALMCVDTQLSELDISNLQRLSTLYCTDNPDLSTIHNDNCPSLTLFQRDEQSALTSNGEYYCGITGETYDEAIGDR